MPIVLRHELIAYMREKYAMHGQTQFTTSELHEYTTNAFFSANVTPKQISGGLSAMRTNGLAVHLSEVPGAVGGAKFWTLVEIIEAETQPKPEPTPAPIEVFPETETNTEEIHEVTSPNGNDRKPRQGTPEHDIMRLTKTCDRQSEQIDNLVAVAMRLEKSGVESNALLVKSQTAENETIEAILKALYRLKDGVLSTVGEISKEVTVTREDNQHVESSIRTLLEELKNADETYNRAYSAGFAAGWKQREKSLTEAIANAQETQVESLMNIIRKASGLEPAVTTPPLGKTMENIDVSFGLPTP